MTYGQDGIYVNHSGMIDGVGALDQSFKNIEGRLDRLEGDLKPLQDKWSGGATIAYNQAKSEWDRAINEMQVLLAKTSQTVTDSHEGYKDADRRGAALFGQ